jgi:RNA-directed DNA polymerase
MLEKANKVTGKISYARYADDLVVLVSPGKWVNVVHKRLLEEFGKLQVAINQEKSKIVDMEKGESFIFLGFEFKTVRTKNGKYRAQYKPDQKARNELIAKLKVLFRKYRSQPIKWVIEEINPILRGWVNYFRIGNSKETFAYIKMWVDKKIRRHLMRAKKKKGFGWKWWSKKEIVKITGVYYDYRIRYLRQKTLPARKVT